MNVGLASLQTRHGAIKAHRYRPVPGAFTSAESARNQQIDADDTGRIILQSDGLSEGNKFPNLRFAALYFHFL